MAMSISKLFWQQNRRTQLIITIGGIFIALIIFSRVAVFSVIKRIEVLDRVIPQKEIKLKQLLHHRQQYLDLKNQLQAVNQRVIKISADFDSILWLEKEAEKSGLEVIEFKESIAPLLESYFQEKAWQLNFSGIRLEQLTKYLYRIESQDSPVGIKRILITKNTKDKGLLDVALEVYVLIKEAR